MRHRHLLSAAVTCVDTVVGASMSEKRSSRWSSDVQAPCQRPIGVTESALNEEALQYEIELLSKELTGSPLMSEHELATLLGRDLKTVQNRRMASPETLPPFIRVPGTRGVLYMRRDVVRYLAVQIVSSRGRTVHRI